MEALQRTANRGSISTASAYEIDNSVQMNSVTISNPPRFNRTNSSAGNRKTFTVSFWHKRGISAHSNTVGYRVLNSIRNETGKYPGLFVFDYRGTPASTQFLSAFADEDPDNVAEAWFKSDMGFHDYSAWYHIVIAYDTTQATASNRKAMYVNGVEQTYSESGDIPQHHQSSWNDDTLHCIGAYEYNLSDASLGGYLAEVHNIDGLKLDATAFGEFDTSGIWKPKEYDGNYGTNGFRLQFKETGTGQDANGLGADTSGNNHHFATVGHTAADQATDTPTNNFCTLNVLSAIGDNTYTEGATKGIANAQNEQAEGTFMINKGKWYFEAQSITSAAGMFGFGKPNNWATSDPNNPGNDTSSFAISTDGNVYYNNNTAASGWASYATTDKAMIAVDLDNGFCYFGKNGTWGNSGDPTSGSSGTGGFNYVSLVTNISLGDELVPALRISYTQGHGAMFNFGGYTVMSISSAASDANGYGTFEYAPPTGYYALCTKNLAEFG